MNVSTVNGATIHPAFKGFTFEAERAAGEMRFLRDQVVGSYRDWYFTTTRINTKDEALQALAELIKTDLKRIDQTSCFTTPPVLTENYLAGRLRKMLRAQTEDTTFGLTDIKSAQSDLRERALPNACRSYRAIVQCYFIQNDQFVDDRFVCSAENYLATRDVLMQIRESFVGNCTGSFEDPETGVRTQINCAPLNDVDRAHPREIGKNANTNYGVGNNMHFFSRCKQKEAAEQ